MRASTLTTLAPRVCTRTTQGRGTKMARNKQAQAGRQKQRNAGIAQSTQSAGRCMAVENKGIASYNYFYTHPQSHQRPRSPLRPQILFLLATGCRCSRRRRRGAICIKTERIYRAGEAQYLEIQALPFLDSFFILSHLASLTWHLSQRARTFAVPIIEQWRLTEGT